MSKKKFVTVILITLALVALQVGAAFAAPAQQVASPPTTSTPAPTTGTVTDLQIVTDSTGTQVVQVTMDVNGTSQIFDVSLTTAASLGLIQTDSSGNPVLDTSGNPIVNTTAVGTQITLQSTDILNGGTTTPTNPVASLIDSFFGSTLIGDKDIMTLHDDGNGYGVIAQACFIALQLNNGTTCGQILDAKKGGDYTGLLPADFSGATPTNWGQYKKDFVKSELTNLGAIVSGRATNNSTSTGGDTTGGDTTGGDTTVGGTGGAAGSALSNGSGGPSTNLETKSRGSGHGKGRGHGKGNGNNGNGN